MFLETHDLSRSFQMGAATILAVNQVNLRVEVGEYLAFMGPSGAGKSTLLYLLGGLDRPSSGSIRVQGAEITSMSATELAQYRNQTVGFIFQDFCLQEHLNVLENVELPLKFRGVPRRERDQICRDFITRVGLSQRLTHKPGELSGGERQRVAIARALSSGPKMLLADEPTGNLDSKTGSEIVNLLVELNRQNITMMVVTHNQAVAATAHKIYRIQDGRIETAKGTHDAGK